MFEFEWFYLWLLLPLPLLAYWLIPKANLNGDAIITPFFTASDDSIQAEERFEKSFSLTTFLALLAWLSLIVAAAKPVWMDDVVSLPLEGKNVIIAIDLSGSMAERDFILDGRRVTRLDVVKFAANQFIEKRKQDRIGLVVFGSQAYLYSPLTFDTDLIKQFLNESSIEMAGRETAIGDGIAVAIKHFQEIDDDNGNKEQQEKILILLTDGANSAGAISPDEAMQLAKLENLRIYTIGLSAKKNNNWFFRSSIDEDLLKKIALETNGQYFRAHNTQGLQAIYDALDQLESSTDQDNTFRPTEDLFYYPLSLFFLLAMTIFLLRLR